MARIEQFKVEVVGISGTKHDIDLRFDVTADGNKFTCNKIIPRNDLQSAYQQMAHGIWEAIVAYENGQLHAADPVSAGERMGTTIVLPGFEARKASGDRPGDEGPKPKGDGSGRN